MIQEERERSRCGATSGKGALGELARKFVFAESMGDEEQLSRCDQRPTGIHSGSTVSRLIGLDCRGSGAVFIARSSAYSRTAVTE